MQASVFSVVGESRVCWSLFLRREEISVFSMVNAVICRACRRYHCRVMDRSSEKFSTGRSGGLRNKANSGWRKKLLVA